MDRLRELLDSGKQVFGSYAWIIGRTLWVAFYGPQIVLGIGLLLSAIPYFFYTLCVTPHWIHLYIAVIFVGVLLYRFVFWKRPKNFEVQRGRQMRRSEEPKRGGNSTDSRRKIPRGRQ